MSLLKGYHLQISSHHFLNPMVDCPYLTQMGLNNVHYKYTNKILAKN